MFSVGEKTQVQDFYKQMETWKIQHKTHGIVRLLKRYYLRTLFNKAVLQNPAMTISWCRQVGGWLTNSTWSDAKIPSVPNRIRMERYWKSHRPTVGTTAFFHPSLLELFHWSWNGSCQNQCDILEGALLLKSHLEKKTAWFKGQWFWRGEIPPFKAQKSYFHSGLGNSKFWLARIIQVWGFPRSGWRAKYDACNLQNGWNITKKNVDDPENWHCDAEFISQKCWFSILLLQYRFV